MIELNGGCQCGDVRYCVRAFPRRHSICHCEDCRRSSGAYLVGWAAVPSDRLSVRGSVASYDSSGDVRREFCPRCGTGLFFHSATMFPGEVDIRTATLDEPDRIPPTEEIQFDDAPVWLRDGRHLSRHSRFPPAT